jgi:hypothetical protein
MIPCVIDTNVLLSADAGEMARLATHVPQACRQKALDWLQHVLDEQCLVVVDSTWRILEEYQAKLRSGDFGYLFLQAAFRGSLFEWVPIELDGNGYATLPAELEAVVHDRSDRKFVAVSLAKEPHPPIINCADTDWLDWESCLREKGVEVRYLCPLSHLREK